MKVPTIVLEVLDRAEFDGPRLVLTGTLDRKLYLDTAKVLEAAGGKWNRKERAHLFDGDAAEAIEPVILTGEIVSNKQQFGYFPTPGPVVQQLIELADIKPGMTVLEPSAGQGAIASAVAAEGCVVDCIEVQESNATVIFDAGYANLILVRDFLTTAPGAGIPGYDRVVMNPPFARQDDIRHVMHAHRFLKAGGLLVAVMSNGVTFRNTPLTREFRALLDMQGGELHPLPEGAFKESGTGVNTVIAVIPKVAAHT
ncbi:methyltransferase [Streptomyces azureus]|uniref:Lambda phage type II DNA modification methyltransferase n=1 Tax=Streptomyces azureus TaxID=146537 RepID=A0A0K8PGU4_STRAJ|nr:methyltransferase [Streptomyces azureus]GAP46933.1 lambda phage type II DNA modification methyltransferase [Streptomyces azureus]